MVHLGDEPRLVSLGKRTRSFEIDEEILPHGQRRDGLANQRIGTGHAARHDPVLGKRRGALNLTWALPSLPVTTLGFQ